MIDQDKISAMLVCSQVEELAAYIADSLRDADLRPVISKWLHEGDRTADALMDYCKRIYESKRFGSSGDRYFLCNGEASHHNVVIRGGVVGSLIYDYKTSDLKFESLHLLNFDWSGFCLGEFDDRWEEVGEDMFFDQFYAEHCLWSDSPCILDASVNAILVAHDVEERNLSDEETIEKLQSLLEQVQKELKHHQAITKLLHKENSLLDRCISVRTEQEVKFITDAIAERPWKNG